eukprot:5547214-Prymnesium_polylepis.1
MDCGHVDVGCVTPPYRPPYYFPFGTTVIGCELDRTVIRGKRGPADGPELYSGAEARASEAPGSNGPSAEARAVLGVSGYL